MAASMRMTYSQGKLADAWAALMQPSANTAGMIRCAGKAKVLWSQIHNWPHIGLCRDIGPSVAHQRQRSQPAASGTVAQMQQDLPDSCARHRMAGWTGANGVVVQAPVSLRQQKEDNAKRVVAE